MRTRGVTPTALGEVAATSEARACAPSSTSSQAGKSRRTRPDSSSNASEPAPTVPPSKYQLIELPGIASSESKADAALDCIFCRHADPALNSVIRRRGTVFARWDNFPASHGHVEIVPFRHVRSFFDLTEAEVADMHILAKAIRIKLDKELRPDSYTIGINDGPAAGQTVPHVHLHIIPRWLGDVPDPRGGIRRIFPECDPSEWLK